MGFQEPVRRSTLADANESRDWRIYAEFAQRLIAQARKLYAREDLGLELANTVYALDSTTIDLCLSAFPWALFRSTKSAVKMHTLLDLKGSIPSFIHISDGKMGDVHALDLIVPEAGAIYVMDRGYIDFARLHALHRAGSFFCNPRQIEPECAPGLLPDGGQGHWLDLRPDHCAGRLLRREGLSRSFAPRPLQRPRQRQEAGLPEQPLRLAGADRLRPLQKPLAGRIVLQVDQATSSHQAILWNLGECRENPNLDRHLGLRACRHRQEKAEPKGITLHFATDFIGHSV